MKPEKQNNKSTQNAQSNTVAEKPVQTVQPTKKPWTRHIKTYYIYNPQDGFLMKDKTFAPTGDLYTFDNLMTAKTIQQFFEGTKILTVVE